MTAPAEQAAAWSLPALRERVSPRNLGIVAAFLALFILLSVVSDAFLTERNLLNILDQWAPTGIIACGATLVIIAGGFDLSVGAVFAVCGIVAAMAANATSPALGLIAGIGLGLGFGVVNGLVTTVGRVNTFIGTLASSIIIRGLAIAITGGFILSADAESFTSLGRSEFLGAKVSVYIFAAVIVLSAFLLRLTPFGRHAYAAGGNAEAARLAGVRVDLVRATTFAISGLLAGLAGVIVASRTGSGQSLAGTGIEFTAIAAVVIGGNSIFGGEGAIWRTVLGVLLLAMIGNGFNLIGVDPTYQQMVQGGIILGAVAIDAWTRRRSR